MRTASSDPNDYSVVVVMRRYHHEDDEIARERGVSLQQQLADELQEAYDHCGISGDFQVVDMYDDGGAAFEAAVNKVRNEVAWVGVLRENGE